MYVIVEQQHSASLLDCTGAVVESKCFSHPQETPPESTPEDEPEETPEDTVEGE